MRLFLLDILILTLLAATANATAAKRVIFVSIDTLRQDHVGLYGYPRPTTPNLDRFAEKCAVFTNAMAQAPYTLPSHMSMMTGLNPWAHGVRSPGHVLGDRYQTIAESLGAAGFTTAAYVDCFLLNHKYGFDQGFDEYHDQRAKGGALNNGFRRFGDDVRQWIEQHGEQPFFLFLHTFSPHGPYQVEDHFREALAGSEPVVPEAADDFGDPMEYLHSFGCHDYLELDRYATLADAINDYDATIRSVDSRVGLLIDRLEEDGLLEDALIIITSDHGEAFLDHHIYMGHGLTLYEEEVRVPLLVKFPGGRFAGTRCDDVVRLTDLFPTIAAASGAECPEEVQGADLVLALEGKDLEPRVATGVSPNLVARFSNGLKGVTAYVRRQNKKYVGAPALDLSQVLSIHIDREAMRDRGEPYDLETDPLQIKLRFPYVDQLYQLDVDPTEQNNLAPGRGREVFRIQTWFTAEQQISTDLAKILHDDDPQEFLFSSEEELEALFGQGYISSSQLKRMKDQLELRKRLEKKDD